MRETRARKWRKTKKISNDVNPFESRLPVGSFGQHKRFKNSKKCPLTTRAITLHIVWAEWLATTFSVSRGEGQGPDTPVPISAIIRGLRGDNSPATTLRKGPGRRSKRVKNKSARSEWAFWDDLENMDTVAALWRGAGSFALLSCMPSHPRPPR